MSRFIQREAEKKAKIKIKVDNKEIENGKGKGIQLEIGKDLFIKGFDKELVGVKKNQKKIMINLNLFM